MHGQTLVKKSPEESDIVTRKSRSSGSAQAVTLVQHCVPTATELPMTSPKAAQLAVWGKKQPFLWQT